MSGPALLGPHRSMVTPPTLSFAPRATLFSSQHRVSGGWSRASNWLSDERADRPLLRHRDRRGWLPDECGPILEASGVDDGADTRRGLADAAPRWFGLTVIPNSDKRQFRISLAVTPSPCACTALKQASLSVKLGAFWTPRAL